MPHRSVGAGVHTDWTRQFFGKLYGDLYRRHLLDPAQTRREAQYVAQELGLGGKLVLDLAAGFGRHANLLARANRVAALDMNAGYLQLARHDARGAARRNLLPVQADMRVLPFASQRFDAVLLLFNSFGYFLPPRPAPAVSAKHELWKLPGVFYERGLVGEDSGVYRDTESDAAMNSGAGPAGAEDGNLAVLQEIARVLRCNGELMLEVANPRPLLAAVAHSPRRRMATRNYEIEEEYSYDPVARVLSNRTRFAVPGEGESAEYHIRLYPRAELCGLLRAAGFAVKRVCGSYEGENYHATRSPLILVHARRK